MVEAADEPSNIVYSNLVCPLTTLFYVPCMHAFLLLCASQLCRHWLGACTSYHNYLQCRVGSVPYLVRRSQASFFHFNKYVPSTLLIHITRLLLLLCRDTPTASDVTGESSQCLFSPVCWSIEQLIKLTENE